MQSWLEQIVSPLDLYSLFQALGFFCAILLGVYHAPKFGISLSRALDGALWIVVSALVGARGLFILLYPNRFPTVKSWFELYKGGQVFFGGVLATLVVAFFYTRYHQMNIRNVGDVVAPSLGLGHCLGRIGCFFGGCCYGAVTNLPWGVEFGIRGEVVFRHPTQLYEAAFLFCLFLWALRKLHERLRLESDTDKSQKEMRGIAVPGRIWGVYMLSYSCFRFMIEFVRDDNRGGFFTPLHLSPSQLVAMGVFVCSLAWLRYCSFKAEQEALPGCGANHLPKKGANGQSNA